MALTFRVSSCFRCAWLVPVLAAAPALAGDPLPQVPPVMESPFSTHRANFLILGPENSPYTGHITSKFQLSLKYDTGANWYFAYSQRSVWDITRESEPAVDHNFEPETFYQWRLAEADGGRWGPGRVRLGFVHESNGRGGTESRAWNRAYVEPHFRRGGWLFEPKLWVILGKDEENRDIADYYGFADIVLGYETASLQRFTVTGRQGEQHGSVRLDLSVPMRSLRPESRMRPYLYAQAWAGYGETLLHYNQYTRAVRIGIEFHP
jgi:outer membrane phospholipase A